ncbi:MAG TPA: polyphosphate kinase 1 [Candidatus Angelobacter sp.]|nr:polyphosphate kinase 1 [Candidatus Angelobacter sp.]
MDLRRKSSNNGAKPDASLRMNRSVSDPSLYINREDSWLAFNRRVLEEANDDHNPLLERVKFLAISASNLDEFFEVRVAGLLQRIEEGFIDAGPDALTAQQERELIARETHEFVEEQYACWNSKLLPALAKENIRVLDLKDLSADQERFIDTYCEKEVDPLLTPVTVDPAHPFPRVLNKALCIALLLKRKRRASGTYMGVITVPRALPRLVHLPSQTGIDFVFLADLLIYHAARMYRGYDILSAASFRVTRNSNLYLEEEETRNLLESVRTELHRRRKGDAVRLEIDASASAEIARRLQQTFELEDWQIFYTQGPVNLSRLFNFYDLERPNLKYRTLVARELRLPPSSNNIFAELRKRDILLHHPFDSFDAVVDFIESAASDPDVISLKQTIYRTSRDSPIVEALISAASAEKEVTAVLELKARFDEASNIQWARMLEDAGVQVYHGLVSLKTHCKLCLLVRHDPDGVTRRYAHIGTGNYNPATARFYTDISLLTCSPEITSAVHSVFNYLTAYSEASSYAPLAISPVDLASTALAQIHRETEHAASGRPARIIAKMNALLDKNVIEALYRASQAGVKIDLTVRGMCSLRPGVPGVSDNIVVRSVVGRLLEHSRIFYFENGGNEEIYISSADWMPRNLYERVEVLCPILDESLKQRIKNEILAAYMADNVKARLLDRNGQYLRLPRKRGQKDFSAQDFLIAVAEGTASAADIPDPAILHRRVHSGSRKKQLIHR